MLESAREIVEQAARAARLARSVGLIHRAADRAAQPLRQGVSDIALLVLAATLNQRSAAEHLDPHLVVPDGDLPLLGCSKP